MSIICGTDLSPGSLHAVEVARALAAQRGDKDFILVHVVEDERHGAKARAGLDAFAASAKAGAVPMRTEVVVGTPEETLVSFAETEGSDLIVISASSSPHTLIRLG
jgi:nucleotide-binding universal stress UspA family protein